MKGFVLIVIVMTVLLILLIQAYSDHKTMLLYKGLNTIGMIITIIAAVFLGKKEDTIYICIALAINWVQGICGVYSLGDAKIYTMIIFLISLFKSGIYIMVNYLCLEVVTICVFIAYVFVCKLSKQKYRKQYPYIPSLFIATIICTTIEIIKTIF